MGGVHHAWLVDCDKAEWLSPIVKADPAPSSQALVVGILAVNLGGNCIKDPHSGPPMLVDTVLLMGVVRGSQLCCNLAAEELVHCLVPLDKVPVHPWFLEEEYVGVDLAKEFVCLQELGVMP